MDDIQKLHHEQTLQCNQPLDVEVDGFILTMKFLEHKDEIQNFEVYDSDVWVCSFPKTGTTWLQEMVWLVANDVDFKRASVALDIRFPFFEVTAMFNPFPVFQDTENKPSEDVLQCLRKQEGPRFIKTHLPWKLLPAQIQSGERKPKIIYITRNPKDVCVSYYNHHRIFGKISYEFEQFCEMFLNDKLEYQPYWHHVLPFWNRRQQENILFLKYEDLKQDLTSVMREVAKFLNVELDDHQEEELRSHLSFENMKENNAVNFSNLINALRQVGIVKYDGNFMRSGVSGGYKKNMTSQLIERFDRWIKENTEDTDFNFYNNP